MTETEVAEATHPTENDSAHETEAATAPNGAHRHATR